MGQAQSTAGVQTPDWVGNEATETKYEKSAYDLLKSLSFAEDDQGFVYRELTIKSIKRWEEQFLAEPKNLLALAAVSKNDMKQIIQQPNAIIDDAQVFSDQIAFDGAPITNQRSSGRCWIFAATSVLRVYLMKKYKLENFELSQQYLFFWDKLEKANFFLEQIIDTSEEPLDSRVVDELLKIPVNDGGQWDMIINLVERYGVVPQKLYPDTYNSMNSRGVNALVTSKLREFALQLRAMSSSGLSPHAIQRAKSKMVNTIYNILVTCFGPPPKPDETFTWEFRDSLGKFHSYPNITPINFFKDFIGYKAASHFSLINDPRHEYGKLYTVSRLNNVFGGKPIRYVNVDMATMKAAIVAMIKKDHPVFFGCDVGKFSDSKLGIMDTKLFDYKLAFDTELGLNKAGRLLVGESRMTHAMTLNGVHIVDGKSVKWKVQNSWGEGSGEKGWFVMTDGWMDEYCYQAVVGPDFVSQEIRDILKQEPTALPLWDPIGALA
ncbi:hypothetical protein TWF569_006278 [Orbilia oligospora]|uniref:Cysteine proteinase 1, mitochondrial n=1 Tax=Orbilia oligospora TaxID=2813651 RepID=A0A7C8JNP3_ORBOL|nr:hypothetical protein TWF706_004650 [Orbilia oligospora]KAF3113466.1 hypothetical protein TWF102_000126 [Orbilia oligospora]KAF3115220.1 hypothetical protein TWF103_011481 [Orbilia oligospora]KAF3146815.1 hypothetical protein TWF569_006278 [Orbilia oligospora]